MNLTREVFAAVMNEQACPYCGEKCDGMTIENGQQVCCGFGCEHCCECDRDDDESREGSGT